MHSKLKKTIAYALCFSMLISSGMASVYSEDAPAEEEAAVAEEAEEEEEEEEAPRTEEEALALAEEVASNSKIKLYANKKEGTIAVEDLNTGKLWWSNPVDVETSKAKKVQKEELASGMSIIYGEPASRATTTQNNKSKGKFKMDINKGKGVDITYEFPSAGITIPVKITLEDDHIKLYVDTKTIVENNPSPVAGQLLTNMSFMTTFGAAGLNDEGYFVIPDGCGAVIDFNNGKSDLKTYNGKVYGEDITAVDTTKSAVTQDVSLPMYGIVKGNSGMMVVADKGDTCATINSYVSNQNNTDYNSTYFSFEVRTSDEYLMGGESNPLKVFEKRGILVPEIEVRYYPVSNSDQSDIDYTDIADSYRNYLIKDKAVEDKDLTDTSSLFLDLYGGTLKTKSIAGIPVTVKEPVTKFITAQYILETLNKMGVEDMVVTYNNYSNENLGEKITDSYSPASKLGGKGKFEDLMDYAASANIKLFPSIDNQQFRTGNGYWNMTNTSIRVSNAYAQIPVYDLAHGIENKYYDSLSLFTPASYDKAFSKYIKSMTKKGVTNFAFGSLSNSIYGDYGKKAVSREMAKGYVESIYSAASSNGSVLADNAAAYVLPYADYVANVPTASSKFDLFDYDIPLYQMVLHGITPYAGIAINSEADISDAVLDCISSGSNISFDLLGMEASDLKDTKLDKYYYAYYANWVNEATAVYNLADAVLSPAADSLIASYTISEDGNEIETVYENGYKTVVNYEKHTITADGRTFDMADYVGEEVIGG